LLLQQKLLASMLSEFFQALSLAFFEMKDIFVRWLSTWNACVVFRVMLKFLSLDMESIGDCGFDYVAVYNGKKSVIFA